MMRVRWLPFVLPLAVFMLVGALEPTPETPGGKAVGLAIPYSAYPIVYTLKIAATVAALLCCWPAYRRFPFRLGWLGIAAGVVGVVVWIGLCSLKIEENYLVPLLKPLGLDGLIAAGHRSGFNPFVELAAQPLWAYAFLALRLFGMAAVVPLVEEFLYRGFLTPFVTRQDWWNVPQGEASRAAIAMAIVLPMAMHPAELLAAAAWFGMVAWLFVRTRNVWECIAAHAVTNLLLGVYVVVWGEWSLM